MKYNICPLTLGHDGDVFHRSFNYHNYITDIDATIKHISCMMCNIREIIFICEIQIMKIIRVSVFVYGTYRYGIRKMFYVSVF